MKMMKGWHSIAAVLFSLFLWNHSGAQEIGARASVDSTDILIGDQLKFYLELTVPSGSKVTWPIFEDTLASHVEIVKRSPIDTVSSAKDKFTVRQELVITSFDSGSYVIPPVPFRFRQKGDTTSYYTETDPLRINVNTVETDPVADIKPIKPPLKAPITFAEIAPWLAGLLALGLIAAGIYYYLQRKKANKPIFLVRQKPKLPPHEIALEAFESLRRRKLWQAGMVKDYYSEMTDIIREYLEGRFNIRALEMTTDEISDALRGTDVEGKSREKLTSTLMSADLVKFAKAQPLPTENDSHLDTCVEFVRATKPLVELRTEHESAGIEPKEEID
jgi:hypothetical protein